MGVSGCGKSMLAAALVKKFHLTMIEADEFHDESNRQAMAAGEPLTDTMRQPWIESLCREISRLAATGRSVVVACSALRAKHRQAFRDCGLPTLFLQLDGDRELIASRLRDRTGHFAHPSLLDSQFDALDDTGQESDVVRVDNSGTRASTIRVATEKLISFGDSIGLG